MDISAILASLKERALWTDARKIIVRAGLQAAQGWPKTLERYSGVDVSQDEADELASGLAEHILIGEKALRFYEISKEEVASLRSYAVSLEVEDSVFSEAFPCLVPDFAAVGGDDSTLCASYDDDDGVFLVFSSVKEFEIREKVDIDSLGDGAAGALKDFSTLYGTRLVQKQVFDVLWIPPWKNVIVAAVDCPKGMPADFISAGHARLRRVIRDGMGDFPQPINLFDSIEKVYKSDWGTVFELGFLTDTGSVKYERMRFDCLRAEPFHVGGKDAVDGVIHPFSITIKWTAGNDELGWEPELSLHSTSTEAHSPLPSLYDAHFRSGISVRDLRRLRRRLVELV